MGSVKVKGILWGLLFLLTAIIFFTIPTKLVVTYWIWLNRIVDIEGRSIYTYALFAVFGYVVAVIVSAVYLAAMARAFVQSGKPEDTPSYGIPIGVKKVAVITSIPVGSLMVIWFLIFQELAIFALQSPI